MWYSTLGEMVTLTLGLLIAPLAVAAQPRSKEAGTMPLLRTAVTSGGVLLMVMALAGYGAELPASEQRKIEALIQHVASLTEAVFMRNNQAYPAKTAAQFLRGKWRATLEDITTAQEFIAKVASVSSTTGQPYRIRFPNGHEMRSGDYLRTVLQQLEQPSKP